MAGELRPFGRGGSGRGCSFYTSAALCPRRAQLDAKLEGQVHNAKTARMDIGTIFHDLADLYHSGNRAELIQYEDAPPEEAMAEAQRLFAWYSANFPMDAWGDVLGTEVQLPVPEEQDKRLYAEQAAAIKGYFGVEFTLRPDLVTRVGPEHAAKIARRTGLDLKLGVYLVDHKTKGRKDPDMHLAFPHSPQFQAYPLAWNLLYPEVQCEGIIANVLITHKKLELGQSNCAVFAPLLSMDRRQALFDWFQNAESLAKTGFANRAACFVRGTCPRLLDGSCIQE